MPKISAVIITLNEEANICRAILTVKPWVDEVIVVDMMSDDRTAELAHSLGAKVFEHPRVKVGIPEPARETAMGYASSEWVLLLDADEMVSSSLSKELQRIAVQDSADVCRLPRLNHILGKPMFHGQHSPDRDLQVRFFKKSIMHFPDRVNSFPEAQVGARFHTVKFAGSRAIYHFHAATATQLIDKMNRYTTLDANQDFHDGKPAAAWRLLLLPPVFFFRCYFLNQGWRDGWRGFYWAFQMAFYRLARDVKHLQLFECGPAPIGEAPYSREAAELLREYDNAVHGNSSPNEVGASDAVIIH